jgi:hypothetical protein
MSKVTTAIKSIDVEPPILNEGMGVISDGYMDIGGGSSNGEMTGP